MGCGCAKKLSRNRAGSAKKSASSKSVIRKRRVSKLISVPGATIKKKAVKKTSG